eukprot:6675330-Pyramimonas_sp.AAC.1
MPGDIVSESAVFCTPPPSSMNFAPLLIPPPLLVRRCASVRARILIFVAAMRPTNRSRTPRPVRTHTWELDGATSQASWEGPDGELRAQQEHNMANFGDILEDTLVREYAMG